MNTSIGRADDSAGGGWAYWRTRITQTAFWVLTIGVLWTLDTLTKMQVRERTGVGLDNFRLFAEQATSAAGVLVMVSFVAWWLNHFPIRRSRPMSTALGHVIGSVIFTLGHYAILFVLRKVIYAWSGFTYGNPASLLGNLIFEYQKDVKIYLGIVVIIAIYRQYLGGENRMQVRAKSNTKMLVQTGSGESIINYNQIDYLESARNYVVVHANNREYLVRDTMSKLLERLAGEPFARCHRSFAVNLNKVEEIKSVDSAQVVRLTGGQEIPVSRNFREEFKAQLVG